MKKLLAILLFIIVIASALTACRSQTLPGPEGSSQTETCVPPQNVPSPEQVVQSLDADAVIMEIGTHTRQVLLQDNTWSEIKEAFTAVGYAAVQATLLENTLLETMVLCAKDVTLTLQNAPDGAYAIWEPYNASALSLLSPNTATGTGEVTLAQIGIAREQETDNPMNGMCYMYKLSDGSAVIIDGGFNTESCRNNILNTLKKMDVAKTADGKYRITAWIFSHGHKDHRAAFTGFGKHYGDQVALSYVLYNFPVSPGPLTTSTFDLANFEEKMAIYYPDAQHVVAHAGLAYHFGNLTVEVLYSPEMLYAPDKTIDYYNDTSLIFIADCSGTRTLYMGDAGEVAATEVWAAYEKDAFCADMLQIAHHGFNTGNESHKWKNIKNIYNATDATYGLLPMGSRLEGDARNGRHTVIVGHGGASLQMSFVVNKRDNHGQGTVSQEYFNQFVADVAAGTNEQETLFGYDGINKIVSDKGLVTYAMGNETEPMVTLFTLSSDGILVKDNQPLSAWLK